LLLLFLLGSTLILPNFSKAWRFCQAKEWVGAHSGTLTNCTTPYENSNTSYVDPAGTSHIEEGETSPLAADNLNADQFCLNCKTPGGYRTTVQGLTLLALVLAIIGIALLFFGKGLGL